MNDRKCEKCKVKLKDKGYRFCGPCCKAQIKAMRESGYLKDATFRKESRRSLPSVNDILSKAAEDGVYPDEDDWGKM